MARSPKGIEQRLETFRAVCDSGSAEATRAAVGKALQAKHRLMVAAAARVCGDRLLYEHEPALKRAFQGFLHDPVKTDKQCAAKSAIVRAMVALDSQDVDFFLNNITYRQFEPAWGGSVDTAVDLRCSCAMGLVSTAYSRALIPLADLLNDSEPRARLGAVRAIACAQPLAAEPLLRHKAGAGDESAEVVGECLLGLLQLEPENSVNFVAGFLSASNEEVAELAALALGESGLDAAFAALKRYWDEGVLLTGGVRRALLRGGALHRSMEARDWLLDLLENADVSIAVTIVEELSVFRHDDTLAERVGQAVAGRPEQGVGEVWRAKWSEES
ncbi:MAG: hypothetical protein KDH88_03670 [Chromatiales bacterium]|nr:hypothetical protein [Chromatiales bacterium]